MIHAGATFPLSSLVIGQLTNDFGALMYDPSYQSKINATLVKYLYLAAFTFVGSFLEISCWMSTSLRQTNRIRQLYLTSALRQDTAFFDTTATSGALMQGLNDEAASIQLAIGEKLGNFLHYMCTFVAGITIGEWAFVAFRCATCRVQSRHS